MILQSILAVLVALEAGGGAPAAEKFCVEDELGYCHESSLTFSLVPGQSNKIRVRVQLGTVFLVRLPVGENVVSPPAVGTMAILKAEMAKEGEQQVIRLWPTLPQGVNPEAAVSLDGIATNVQLTLDSGINLILEIQITSKKGVEILELKDPANEAKRLRQKELKDQVRAEIEEEFRQRAENLEAEVHKKTLESMATGIMKRFNCSEIRERAMNDLLVVWAYRICHIGDHLFIDFEIQNRSKTDFALDKVEFLGRTGEESQPLEALVQWEKGVCPQLRFDQRARGMAVIPITEDTASASYTIKVHESAGKKRVVSLEGVEF
ncbi:MAG TPA: hypothetical protein PLC99_20045 [Verrucomicrobiota bacterium]|nr:hypothetical protein [Verrucomicrobiota bacterium]